MGYLPTLRTDHQDRLVLNAAEQAGTVLVGLARAWREDRDGIAAQLADLAELDDAARGEVQLDGLGNAEHARDQIADQLLTEAGGAEFHLRTDRDRLAAHQARRIAEEARDMADTLEGHAHAITIEVEDAERERAARQDAELMNLRAQLAAIGRPPVLASHPH